MSDNKEKGKEGEEIAVKMLISKGYEILHKNWRYKYAEVDIIARDNQDLVFVEVKLRSYDSYGYPETFVTNAKIKKLAEAADGYRYLHNYQGELRFDVVAILKNEYKEEVEHFVDAFYPR